MGPTRGMTFPSGLPWTTMSCTFIGNRPDLEGQQRKVERGTACEEPPANSQARTDAPDGGSGTAKNPQIEEKWRARHVTACIIGIRSGSKQRPTVQSGGGPKD